MPGLYLSLAAWMGAPSAVLWQLSVGSRRPGAAGLPG